MGKKKVMDRITDFLGLYDSDKYDPEDLEELEEDEQEEEEEERKPVPVAKADEPAPEQPKKSFFSRSKKSDKENKNLIQMKATTDIRVSILEPKEFDDCKEIADCLSQDQPVVVNFEGTDPATKRRITDFVTGTVYALHGSMRAIGPNIIVCAPHNVNVDAEAELYGDNNRGE